MTVEDPPKSSITVASDYSMLAARAALAALLALYGAVRFGPVAGLRVALAGAVFVLLDVAAARWRHGRWGKVLTAAALLLQGAILAAIVLAPAPLGFAADIPAPMLVKVPYVMLLLCFMAANVSATDPSRVLFAGAATICAVAAVGWVALSDPRSITFASLHRADYATFHAGLVTSNTLHYFNRSLWQNQLVETIAVLAVLAVASYRMRALARRSAAEEATREALAAYFSPQLADTIIRSQGLPPQEKTLAVLDLDLVGFTALAEILSPEQSAAGLRAYRQAIEDAVFAEDGAISAFVGDGATAFFGLTSTDACRRALACAVRLARAWPYVALTAFPGHDVRIAIGIDVGLATVGLVGKGRAMSLLFLGSPVTGAEALQRATRDVGATILLSERAHDALGDAAFDGVMLTPVMVESTRAWRADAG